MFLSRKGAGKQDIRREVASRFGYDLSRTVEAIRSEYAFDVSCQGSVPEAIVAFLDSEDFEDAVRLAISLGGDADTQAAIAGSIAEGFYGPVPARMRDQALARLTPSLRFVADEFARRFRIPAEGHIGAS